MRKVLVFLLSAVLLCAMVGCGGSIQEASSLPAVESSRSTSTTTTSTTATTTTTTTTTTTATTTTATTTTTTTTTATATTTTKLHAEEGTYIEEVVDDIVTTTTTTMSKEQFLSQIKITHVGSEDDEKNWVYQLGFNGLMVREATIDSGRGGEAVEIVQVTDIHFNYLNDKDFQENDATVMATYESRGHMANGASRKNAELCMRYGSFFDQTVVTGDTIDYLTWGAIEMLEEIIWKPYPKTLVSLGNHDPIHAMGETLTDSAVLETRYKMLQENWKHDIHYTSKVLKNKAMIIQMNNALYDGDQYVFRDEHLTKLKKDLATARSKGYVVLLFVHVPLATNNPAETKVAEIARTPKHYNNFYIGANSAVVGGITSTGVTYEVWDLIMNSADVIRGVFAGHLHEDYYAEMLAKTPSGEDKIIPQYVNHAAFSDNGHVLKITVK